MLTRAGGRKSILLFALGVVVLFLFVNREAYGSYFTDDDLSNMVSGRTSFTYYLRALIEPAVTGDRAVRAVGFLYYHAMIRLAGMEFVPYIAGIHLIHLLNVLLLWLLARALGAEALGACAAALLYVFHASFFTAFWSAIYVFDVLCATCVLAALLSYVRGHVWLSLIFFWLSLKSKEITILFPLVLAAYEFTLGERRWKRVSLFLAISVVVGTRAFLANTGRDDDYTFRFTPVAVWTCIRFYAEKLALFPYGGLAVLAIPFVARSRRVWFGVLTFLLLLAPMLFLPGRLFAAYLYVPMIGLAVALSTVNRPVWLAVLFLFWLPWNYIPFHQDAQRRMTVDAQRRVWLGEVATLVRVHPKLEGIVYAHRPLSLEHWGIAGMADLIRQEPRVRVVSIDTAEATALLASPEVAVLTWDEEQRISARHRTPDAAYIRFDNDTPLWQLLDGFDSFPGPRRWMNADARARLLRPAGAKQFQVALQAVFRGTDRSRVAVTMGGEPLGEFTLSQEGPAVVRLPVPPGSEQSVEIAFHVTPPIANGSNPPLGHLMEAFGFIE